MKIGTCSWKYPEWENLVYTHKPENMLAEYSKLYSTVEVDQWFWSLFDGGVKLPDSAVALDYNSSVDENFTFSIKLPDSLSLTHMRDSSTSLRINPNFLSVELLEKTLTQLKPLLGKTSVLMFQFGYLNKKMMSGLDEFLILLEDFISALPPEISEIREGAPLFGIEIRNPQYYSEKYFATISRLNLVPVLTHGYYLPPVFDTIAAYSRYFSTELPTLLRLHGPDRKEMERLSGSKWKRIIRPMDDDMAKVVDAVHSLESQGIESIINVNNHYEGCAPLSIKKLLEQL